MKNNIRKSNKAFTLLELVITIVVIAYWPHRDGATASATDRSEVAAAETTLRSIDRIQVVRRAQLASRWHCRCCRYRHDTD